jgi:SAM-dependent methyltransferase
MPTSIYDHIPILIEFLRESNPCSILDIGVGNGKIGFVAREILDIVGGGSYLRKDWRTRIDGIEIFPDYVQAHQRAIYDGIYIGDAFDILPGLEIYDLIVLGDVLEHFEKQRGWDLLDLCVAHARRHLIINIPLGENWQQGEMYGNPHERHRSVWSWPDFEPFVWKYKIFGTEKIAYGTFLICREHYELFKRQRSQAVLPPGQSRVSAQGRP